MGGFCRPVASVLKVGEGTASNKNSWQPQNRPQDPSEECCVNYYKEGDICKECPAGYYGDYCSEICRYPVYGSLCSKTCTCSPCHHIYGCNSTHVTTESTMIATTDETENITQTIGRTETYENILFYKQLLLPSMTSIGFQPVRKRLNNPLIRAPATQI